MITSSEGKWSRLMQQIDRYSTWELNSGSVSERSTYASLKVVALLIAHYLITNVAWAKGI
jgi:hypothetical protein